MMKIYKNESGNFYTLEFTTSDGYHHYIDPFKTYNEAYEWWRRYYANLDDLK